MVEKAQKLKKVSFSEEDLSFLLQRYTARTVLTLLQEVDQYSDVKIDWNELVKKTSTGIDNAREYQMLWRHLAYRNTMLDKMEDGAEPLDDESDLECELETFPPASSEASNDAAAFVKVLSDSAGLASDSSLPNNSAVEGPLIINIPTCQSSRAPLENSQPACLLQGTNIAVPVFVQKQSPAHKQPLTTVTSAEGLDSNGFASGSLPRRKRKPWSEAEDLELLSAVQRCGEGNWANILRGDFKGERTASQLSQRWAIIRKRHGNINVGGANTTGPHLSEAQLAARHAMSLALKMPVKNSPAASTVGTVGTTINTTTSNTSLPPSTTETSNAGSSIAQTVRQSQPGSMPPKSSSMGSTFPIPKPRVIAKKTSTKSNINPECTLKATAFAAGARIATQSDAESLLKAAQANNAVHIMPTGGSLMKPSIPGGAGTQLGAHPNVHYICTGLASTPHSAYPSTTNTLRPGSVKSPATTIQHTPSTSTPSTMSPDLTNAFMSSLATELPSKQDVKAVEEIKVTESDIKPKDQVYKRACLSGNKRSEPVREDKAAATNSKADLKSKVAVVGNPSCLLKTETTKSDEPVAVVHQSEQSLANGSQVTGLTVKKEDENQSAVSENGENQSGNEKQTDLPSCKESSS